MKTKLAFSLPIIILGILIAIAPMSFTPVCGPMDMPMHGDSSTMKMGKDDSMKDMDHDKMNMDSDKKDHDKMDMDHDKMNMDSDKKDMDHDKMNMDSDKMDMKDTDKGETQALQIAAPTTVKAHGGHKWMKCHWTAQASLGIGIVIALLGVLIFFGDPRMRIGLNLAVVLNSALELAIVHFLIGMCGNPEMHCNALTKPTLSLLSVLTLILGAVFAYLDFRRPVAVSAATEDKLA
ncbi:hypothetical protein HMPREF0580_0958 [Mobiluncus mulieris ATCC 35239]|uniref:DUF4418 domain-containing protein n=2 Tax=Mobiluncus mulieris TaxID=2052 RepID=E0QQ31_9ACTO|nr:DUF4418 family protein [Mobiluncus mulieris]EFM46411.1 hypothetical protein HMPREF0580_0958 [Mobiluncus mulieris ATCC 35239]MCU9970402.1 DUF4418 family protein [Mobiluncus mulieris]MCU9975357.1 DUF4418 family protein [Mobiluncus mulieris]MCU9993124.1 DUF4418 family protein [Mobiluncus mulieris]MCV0013294.1 DUF4418 family protein [Mobiluncus mulieris]